MIRLLLLLIGATAVRRRWRTLVVAGMGWVGLGLFTMLDALDEKTLFPLRNFGYLLIVEAAVCMFTASAGVGGMSRRNRSVEAFALLVAGLLTIEAPWRTKHLGGVTSPSHSSWAPPSRSTGC